ncbi:malate/lactate/ureidoglycolate dehydrogenase [Mesorhizobium sp. B2-8-3]|uniref:malate/lactate/ureidoglycolate dehydrogenase n=1 Tax=Mesorhizobium sp. B2-8-3 TaxID=2589905 RepID=UPI001FEDA325|nr:malate/lactate/ureidoglycolate dehydrogenase [Mesorhizobium sp. B2-8-3]
MVMEEPTYVIPAARLKEFVATIFATAGCARDEAYRIGHYLLSANLAGHDSHGVIRTPRYLYWLRQGYVLPGQTLTVVSEGPSFATVDGNWGFGQTIGPLAVDTGVEKARAAGVSMIGLRNSSHLGRIGDWAERAADAGLVSLHFVNVGGGELVAPFGGIDRRFSTNPICIGVPSDGKEPMFLLDFATSLVAEGKVLVASNGGKPVPEGALVGLDGKFTSDPSALYGPIVPGGVRDLAHGEGALVAFGLHKGSGLAFMCEILAGILAGGATSGPIPGGKRGRISNGMLSIYLDPARFGEPDFLQRARAYANYVKASRPTTPGTPVLVPGEPEARSREERLRSGVPLQKQTWDAICAAALSLGVQPPTL